MDILKCSSVSPNLGTNTTCSECCSGDLCNAGGCGAPGFDPILGPICYACNLQIGAGSCSKIQQCGRDQECSIRPVYRLGGPDDLFETKCTGKNVCDTASKAVPSTLVGRKRSNCAFCCNSTLCNNFDNRACANFLTPSTFATPTMLANTPTTTVRTSSSATITVSATSEGCEDKVVCHTIACLYSVIDFLTKNCRKTCGLCGGTAKLTSLNPVTIQASSTDNGVTTHTHSIFCKDIAIGCNFMPAFCTLDEYKSWALVNCRRTCNYC
ncbi:uncharacterized protein LOC132713757 [Ruditapes philippinarum]|uniref:uncharacterized protein LOC132713757 n=1 Tax=Ruditapes philippinarum TaxID=129788 RepID=UPI00295B0008|nr:uncharacterized protein LOC132713757 [Ruditapes philippinarum]